MTDPANTVSIAPTKRHIQAAFEHAGITLGGALTVMPDGNFSVDPEAEDFPALLSELTGIVLADHAVKTMVLPSNAQSLQRSIDRLRDVLAHSRGTGNASLLEDVLEDLDDVRRNLVGLSEK